MKMGQKKKKKNSRSAKKMFWVGGLKVGTANKQFFILGPIDAIYEIW